MAREAVKGADTARLNTLIRQATFRDLRIVAAELGKTISEAADYLLTEGVKRYVTANNGTSGKPHK